MLGYHHNLIQHTQLHFTQAKVTNVSSLHLSATLSTYQYILVCTCDVQVHTYTLHTHTSFQSGTIAFATLTSLLPTLATSAPSMLRESKISSASPHLQIQYLSTYKVYTCTNMIYTSMYWYKLSTYIFVPDHQRRAGAYPHLQTC
jgi:hypothetical protein